MAASHSTGFRSVISARQRIRMDSLYRQAIDMRRYEGVDPCVYCGVVGNSIDHVPPRSARERIVALGLKHQYPFYEVRACRECNSVLGARGLWTLTSRRDYIKKTMRRRYADILRIPDWTDSELAQMSEGMRGYVLNGIYVRDFIKERIAYSEPMLKTA